MSELLNLVGLSTGVVLYAMLLAMVVRAGRAPRRTPRFDPLLLATAVLGLVWNLCALPATSCRRSASRPVPVLIAVGFCALGFLPAVVVHRCCAASATRRARLAEADRRVGGVRGQRDRRGCSTSHARVDGAPLPSPLGMRLLTYAFIALVVPLAAVTRGQPGARRALWAAALSIFAVSALHLSQLHQGDASWPVELLGHHAVAAAGVRDPLSGLSVRARRPVPEARADAARARRRRAARRRRDRRDSLAGRCRCATARDVGVLVTLWVATALLYPTLRDVIGWFVDTRPARSARLRGAARATSAARAQQHEDIAALLDDVCARSWRRR